MPDSNSNIHESVFIHPQATVVGLVQMKENCSVWPGAVIRADLSEITIGRSVNIQDGAVLHTDMSPALSIGDYSLIGHKAMLHGCTVGRACLIGIDSTILDGAVIGDGAMIAAGCLIRGGSKIPPFALVTPGPGGRVKIFENKSKTQRIIAGSIEYMRLAEMHRSGSIRKMTEEELQSLTDESAKVYRELFG